MTHAQVQTVYDKQRYDRPQYETIWTGQTQDYTGTTFQITNTTNTATLTGWPYIYEVK